MQDELVPQARRFAGVVHDGYQFFITLSDDCLKIDPGFLRRLSRVEPIAAKLMAPQTPSTEVVRSLYELRFAHIDSLLERPALLQDCKEPADQLGEVLRRLFPLNALSREFGNNLGGVASVFIFTPGGGFRMLQGEDLSDLFPQHGGAGIRLEMRLRMPVEPNSKR
jgi:hypothetical protein